MRYFPSASRRRIAAATAAGALTLGAMTIPLGLALGAGAGTTTSRTGTTTSRSRSTRRTTSSSTRASRPPRRAPGWSSAQDQLATAQADLAVVRRQLAAARERDAADPGEAGGCRGPAGHRPGRAPGRPRGSRHDARPGHRLHRQHLRAGRPAAARVHLPGQRAVTRGPDHALGRRRGDRVARDPDVRRPAGRRGAPEAAGGGGRAREGGGRGPAARGSGQPRDHAEPGRAVAGGDRPGPRLVESSRTARQRAVAARAHDAQVLRELKEARGADQAADPGGRPCRAGAAGADLQRRHRTGSSTIP